MVLGTYLLFGSLDPWGMAYKPVRAKGRGAKAAQQGLLETIRAY